MAKEALDKFGSILMHKVRDAAISDWKMIIRGKMRDQRSQEIHQTLKNFGITEQNTIEALVPEIVDTALHHFLWMLEDEEDIELAINCSGERIESIKRESDGLCGELYSDNGWIARFSKEYNEK
ncbi:MAG: hypothetical protein JW725_05225 [Candidatus Babeliaceae bacterium]|nr:hypothetical protein [Candidatus Babeliaceae bacterium]